MEESHHGRDQAIRSHEIEIRMPIEENIKRLYEASKIGSIQDLKTLIQEDPDIVHKVLAFSSYIESPLNTSVSYGHLEFSQFLLDQKPELAGEVDTVQRTPLHLACINGEIEIVRALLEKNTSVCLVRDLNGLIPLHHAVIGGNVEIIQELIKARLQSIWIKLGNGQTVLHLCVKDNHLEAIKVLSEVLLIHNEEFLNSTDDSGNTILDLSLMLRQVEIVRYLLSIPGIKTGVERHPRSSYNYSGTNQQIENIQRERLQSDQLLSMSSTEKKSGWKFWMKKLKYKGDWLQEVQGTMMLVATVIAAVTFDGAINPPGGVWQQDVPYSSLNNLAAILYEGDEKTIFLAGTAIMACQNSFGYGLYLLLNTISFLASVGVILLIISRFPLKNRICGCILTLAMCVAVAFLALAYLQGIGMVNSRITYNPQHSIVKQGYTVELFNSITLSMVVIVMFWGVVGVICLRYMIRVLIWVCKRLYGMLVSKSSNTTLI